jgi:hypothetical protein
MFSSCLLKYVIVSCSKYKPTYYSWLIITTALLHVCYDYYYTAASNDSDADFYYVKIPAANAHTWNATGLNVANMTYNTTYEVPIKKYADS